MNEDGAIHQQHIAARRAYLDELIARLSSGLHGSVTLDATECLTALNVLEDVRDGYDAREYFEIPPTPGSRPTVTVRDKLITLYFLRLTMDAPALKKQHQVTVAGELGWMDGDNKAKAIKDVGRIVSENRDELMQLAASMSADQILYLLRENFGKHSVR